MTQNYLIIGDDEYLKKKELSGIRDGLLSREERGTNFLAFSASELEQAMAEAATMPFLAEKRIVFLSDIEELTEPGLNTLVSYLESPAPTTVMAMTAPSNYAWKKKAAYNRIAPLVNIKKASSPGGEKMKTRIRSFLKKHDIEISEDAVELITELKGTDSGAVKTALDKLISYSGGERIERGTVERLVGRSITESVYDLVGAITSGDRSKIFAVLEDLYAQRKSAHEVIGYLAWHIRTMQQIQHLLRKGADQKAIAKDLGYSPYYTKKLISASRGYDAPKIKVWNELLTEADLSGKTGAMDAETALELLLIKLSGCG